MGKDASLFDVAEDLAKHLREFRALLDAVAEPPASSFARLDSLLAALESLQTTHGGQPVHLVTFADLCELQGMADLSQASRYRKTIASYPLRLEGKTRLFRHPEQHPHIAPPAARANPRNAGATHAPQSPKTTSACPRSAFATTAP